MPFMLIPHIFGTRILAQAYDFDDTYAYVVHRHVGPASVQRVPRPFC